MTNTTPHTTYIVEFFDARHPNTRVRAYGGEAFNNGSLRRGYVDRFVNDSWTVISWFAFDATRQSGSFDDAQAEARAWFDMVPA